MIRLLYIVAAFAVLLTNTGWAQPGRCPQLPKTYEWNAKEDYRKDREIVKKTLRWLCNNPLGVDIQTRSVANAFVLEWLAGTPDMTLDIQTRYLPFVQDHPELLYSFIHGAAYYKMNHPESTTLKLYMAGFETVARLAGQSKELKKSSSLRPLLKAARKNQLREFTRTTLAL